MRYVPEIELMKVVSEVGIMNVVPEVGIMKVAPEVGIMKVVLLQAVFPHIQQGAHRQVTKCKGLALEQLQTGQKLLGKSAKGKKINSCQIKLRSLCYVNDYQGKCLLFGPNMDVRCMGLAVHCSLCELGQGLWTTILHISDILVWIRIRVSMPLINGSGCGSGSCYFRH
jgi:hypothetical protein